MRRALVPALAAALSACRLLTSDFRLAGSVDVSPPLRDRAARSNATLFVVAENEGGVPVAVLRIVNPQFPAEFKMGSEDLLVPALRRGERLKVHAEMNARGDVGAPRPGDLEGDVPGVVASGAIGVLVVLDRSR
jgi:hypothetical protein